jgi:hypothetical protein
VTKILTHFFVFEVWLGSRNVGDRSHVLFMGISLVWNSGGVLFKKIIVVMWIFVGVLDNQKGEF